MKPISHLSPFRRAVRIVVLVALTLLALFALVAALGLYFLYVPEPEAPQLKGDLVAGSMQSGGLKRDYTLYVPRALRPGAPLLVVMHGSGESGARIREGTGFGFERLADVHGFAVVYPDARTFDWNDCSNVGDYRVAGVEVDDLGFLVALSNKLIAEHELHPGRIFATGVSAGGSMALRLAFEAPATFSAVAAVAASVPEPKNFKCTPGAKASSVMIMNGTRDPLVPFEGGEVNLLGLFFKAGHVRSSHLAAEYLAGVNGIAARPLITHTSAGDGVQVEHLLWREGAKPEVELVAIHGGGHGLPQPYARRPRLLGPSPMSPNGPELIWSFFARQKPGDPHVAHE